MATKFYKNEKFLKVLYPVLYFVLLVAFVCCSCYAFSKLYYEEIYVSGISMNPTLNGGIGGRCHYGKADKSKRVLDRLGRFDVVITYFPQDWTDAEKQVYIIKRVWGFPGETITIADVTLDEGKEGLKFTATYNGDVVSEYTAVISENEPVDIGGQVNYIKVATFDVGNKKFRVWLDGEKRTFSKELSKDEYFIMGDHWGHSSDSYYYTVEQSMSGYIKRSNLQGRVVQIEGTARVENGKLLDKQKISGMYEF